MKIHGTAKGGAISKKDFGVAFKSGGGTPSYDLLWEQTLTGELEGLRSGNVTIAGESFFTGHVVIGEVPTKITVSIRKTGDITGTATLKLIDSSNNEKASFGSVDMDDLTETFADEDFINNDNTEEVEDGDKIAFYYDDEASFLIELCASCTEANTNSAYYISSWTTRTRIWTMKIYTS